MFFSQLFLSKKGVLGSIWIAAHLERRLRKSQINDLNIPQTVDTILNPEVPIALRLSGHLLLGVVRIYNRKVGYLFADCTDTLTRMQQAFAHPPAATTLPPTSATASFHALTLPETFELEPLPGLPESMLKGPDKSLTTREQITLPDPVPLVDEGFGFLGSQYRFDDQLAPAEGGAIMQLLEDDEEEEGDQQAPAGGPAAGAALEAELLRMAGGVPEVERMRAEGEGLGDALMEGLVALATPEVAGAEAGRKGEAQAGREGGEEGAAVPMEEEGGAAPFGVTPGAAAAGEGGAALETPVGMEVDISLPEVAVASTPRDGAPASAATPAAPLRPHEGREGAGQPEAGAQPAGEQGREAPAAEEEGGQKGRPPKPRRAKQAGRKRRREGRQAVQFDAATTLPAEVVRAQQQDVSDIVRPRQLATEADPLLAAQRRRTLLGPHSLECLLLLQEPLGGEGEEAPAEVAAFAAQFGAAATPGSIWLAAAANEEAAEEGEEGGTAQGAPGSAAEARGAGAVEEGGTQAAGAGAEAEAEAGGLLTVEVEGLRGEAREAGQEEGGVGGQPAAFEFPAPLPGEEQGAVAAAEGGAWAEEPPPLAALLEDDARDMGLGLAGLPDVPPLEVLPLEGEEAAPEGAAAGAGGSPAAAAADMDAAAFLRPEPAVAAAKEAAPPAADLYFLRDGTERDGAELLAATADGALVPVLPRSASAAALAAAPEAAGEAGAAAEGGVGGSWSWRTRGAARFLQKTFERMQQHEEEAEQGEPAERGPAAPSLSLFSVVQGSSKKEAARMFFETLVGKGGSREAGLDSASTGLWFQLYAVLKTRNLVQAEQEGPYADIIITPQPTLMTAKI